MPIVDLRIINGADDGFVLPEYNSIYPANGDVGAGMFDSLRHMHSWLRFPLGGLSFPARPIVTVAYVRQSEYGSSSQALTRFRGCLEAAPPPPSSYADFAARPRTVAAVEFDGDPGGNGWAASPSLVPLLQELFDTFDYNGLAEAAIMLFHEDNGSPPGARQHSLGFEIAPVGDYGAWLHFEYVLEGTPVPLSVSPATVIREQTVDLEITGWDFNGVTNITFYAGSVEDTGIIVNQVTVHSSVQMTVNITVMASSPVGSKSIGIANSIGEGVGLNLFSVKLLPRTALDPGPTVSTFSYGLGFRYLSEAATRRAFIDGCLAYGINTWICAFDASVFGWLQEEATVAAALQEFTDAGIRVWASRNNSQDQISAGFDDLVDGYSIHNFEDAVLMWNAAHAPSQRFSGIHFDLEPLSASAGGGTAEVNRAHLEQVAETLATVRAHTISGQSVAGQSLPIILFADGRYGSALCLPAWEEVVNLIDMAQIEVYSWDDSPTGIDTSVAYVEPIMTAVSSLARYFTACMSADELAKTKESRGSRYHLGRAVFEQHRAAYDAYYGSRWPALYRGHDVYTTGEGGFNSWCFIQKGEVFPGGTLKQGQLIEVAYQVFRLTDRYEHRVYGAQLKLTDARGASWVTSKIEDMGKLRAVTKTIGMVIPEEAADGPASLQLSVWGIGYCNEGRYDMLYYEDYTSDRGSLLSMTMQTLPLSNGRRSPYILLQEVSSGKPLVIGEPVLISDIKVTALSVSPNPAVIGQAVTITVTAQNFGQAVGSGALQITGSFSLEQEITLAPGETGNAIFTVTPPTAGLYDISSEELTVALEVKPETKGNAASVALVLGLLGVIAIARGREA